MLGRSVRLVLAPIILAAALLAAPANAQSARSFTVTWRFTNHTGVTLYAVGFTTPANPYVVHDISRDRETPFIVHIGGSVTMTRTFAVSVKRPFGEFTYLPAHWLGHATVHHVAAMHAFASRSHTHLPLTASSLGPW
jgi:hypothetical protein